MEEQLRALRLEKEMEEQRDKQQREKVCVCSFLSVLYDNP